ncbi:MAG: hypothetical protein QM734_11955 [Cyclobacteriaceae bacterium]
MAQEIGGGIFLQYLVRGASLTKNFSKSVKSNDLRLRYETGEPANQGSGGATYELQSFCISQWGTSYVPGKFWNTKS